MKKSTKGLDFHQTFKPERTCLTSLLTDLEECSGKNLQEISKITGIPTGSSSGKVAPTIYYLDYMGLISNQLENKTYQMSYTDLGKCVLQEDPGFMEDLTLLLLHCMLARRKKGADLWSFVICDLLPKYHGFVDKSYFNEELKMYFGKEVNITPFNGSYTGLFDQISILKISDAGYKFNPCTFNSEYIYLYGYILYEYWDDWACRYSENEKLQKKVSLSELTANQLQESGFRNPFGWSEKEEYHVLEILHEKNIIVLNRQMTPFSVRKVASKTELIDLLYSELC